MRIFPNAFEGIHPDWPPNPQPQFHGTGILTFSTLPTFLVGGFSWIATRFRRSPRALRIANYATTATLVATEAVGISYWYSMQHRIALDLQAQGVKTPSPLAKIVDRLGYWDRDNVKTLSVVGGYAGAAMLRLPVYGRVVSALLVGNICDQGYASWQYFYFDATARINHATWSKRRQEQWMKYAPSTSKGSRWSEQPIGLTMQEGTEGQEALIPAHKKVGCDLTSWPDTGNEPHVLDEETGGFLPATRYNWNPAPTIAIRELEDHINTLQASRQGLSLESEIVWRWLAEKEKAFYNCVTARGPMHCTEERRAVETLGASHTDIWRTITDYDWMILDAQKRLSQYQALAATGTRLELESPALSPEAAAAEPKATIMTLQAVLEEIEQRKQELKFLDADWESKGLQEGIEELKKVVPAEELENRIEELKTGVQDAVESAELDERVIKELIKEAEKRVWKD